MYDQIELCKEFIYVHSGTSHSFYYPYGKVSTSDDNKYDYRFYENGKIGLKDENGDPAPVYSVAMATFVSLPFTIV